MNGRVPANGLGFWMAWAISAGASLAIAISWSQYQSVLWAMLHGWFSWVYVLYYVVTRD